jgi:hypothetical protein
VPLPEVPVVVDAAAIDRTVGAIRAIQTPSGCIPHTPGAKADPWNHIEAAMALDAGGRHADAEHAYRWLASMQRRDGAWEAGRRDDDVVDPTLDANFSAYVATGVWHHYMAAGNDTFVAEMWPVVERAIDFTLDLQTPTGVVMWARDARYEPWPGALLTSSSCIFLSLRCAIAIAEMLEQDRPDWELSLELLGRAVAMEDGLFEPKRRFSMDWYYPVLSGVVRADAAVRRLEERWDEFVVEGLGVRCVSNRPWITSGESAELVITLASVGLQEEAETLFRWMQHLRSDEGCYWMGATFPDGKVWPREKPAWGSGAVVLAADALVGSSPTSTLFDGRSLPEIPDFSKQRVVTDPK